MSGEREATQPVQFGVFLPQRELGHRPDDLFRFIQAVETEGFDFIQVTDHVLGADPAVHPGWSGPYDVHDLLHESFVLLGYLAGTTGLGLVTAVLVLPQRQTALVAKQAAEVDALSGGRLRLGVGVGWNAVEYDALGVDFETRGQRCEEQIHLLRRLWTEESVTFHGRFDHVEGAGILPGPVQRPIPIWIGGGATDRVLRRIGRLADGWLRGGPVSDSLARDLSVVHQAALDAGRSQLPGLQLGARVEYDDADALRHEIDAAMALGASHFSIRADRPTDPDDRRRTVQEYLDILGFAAGVICEYSGVNRDG